MKSFPDYYLGLDLGQAKDYTALAIIERYEPSPNTDELPLSLVRHLQRYELGTSYPAIVAHVADLLKREPLKPPRQHDGRPIRDVRPTLAVDGTGVGRGVVDLFHKENLQANLCPITITAGLSISSEDGYTRVPKRDLVGAVQVGLQTSRLKIAEKLPEAGTLTRELQNFQVKITENANDTYGAWREGTHDDLVLAVAMALWAAGHFGNCEVQHGESLWGDSPWNASPFR